MTGETLSNNNHNQQISSSNSTNECLSELDDWSAQHDEKCNEILDIKPELSFNMLTVVKQEDDHVVEYKVIVCSTFIIIIVQRHLYFGVSAHLCDPKITQISRDFIHVQSL